MEMEKEIKPKPKEKPKKVNLERELPKFGTAMTKHLAGLTVDVKKALASANLAAEKMEKTDMSLSDRPSHMLTSTLQFRMQLAVRWLGDSDKVIVLGKQKPAAAVPAAATAAAATAVTDAEAETKEQPKDQPDAGADEATPKKQRTGDSAAVTSSPAPSEASLQIVFASADDDVLAAYKEKIRRQDMCTLLKNNPQKRPFDGEAKDFLSHVEMQSNMQLILEMEDADKFVEARDSWNRTVNLVKEFAKNLSRAATDVVGHIKSLETKCKIQKERADKEAQKKIVAKAREDAKTAADAIRATMEQSKSKPSFLDLPFDTLNIPKIKLYDGKVPEGASLDEPFILEKHDAQKLWCASKPVDKLLASYAISCKKAQDYKATGRGQQPMLDQQAASETTDLVSKILPPDAKFVDIAKVEGGEKFMKTVWCYSFAPGTSMMALPPNCAAFVKTQVFGHTTVILINVQSLLNYAESDPELQPAATAKSKDRLLEELSQWKLENVKKALTEESTEPSLEMRMAALGPNASLFVPVGWLTVELVPKDQSVVYGIRKSMFIDTKESKEAYKTLRELYQGDNRDVTRMNVILSSFES